MGELQQDTDFHDVLHFMRVVRYWFDRIRDYYYYARDLVRYLVRLGKSLGAEGCVSIVLFYLLKPKESGKTPVREVRQDLKTEDLVDFDSRTLAYPHVSLTAVSAG